MVAILLAMGRGSQIDKRKVRKGEIVMPGKTTEGTRSLGCIVTANCSYTAERKERQKAIRQAFQQVGTFWTEPGIPWKWK
eukprot:15762920-Heterocapsa_arctica.AAC.1